MYTKYCAGKGKLNFQTSCETRTVAFHTFHAFISPLPGSKLEDWLLLYLHHVQIHADFKELVDNLLTDFLAEMGVSAETFYEIVSAEKDKDKLTEFVIKTILTVDDFLMFKAMMVKRNIDLTNQVSICGTHVYARAGRPQAGNKHACYA